jgi:hypothetical protein
VTWVFARCLEVRLKSEELGTAEMSAQTVARVQAHGPEDIPLRDGGPSGTKLHVGEQEEVTAGGDEVRHRADPRLEFLVARAT